MPITPSDAIIPKYFQVYVDTPSGSIAPEYNGVGSFAICFVTGTTSAQAATKISGNTNTAANSGVTYAIVPGSNEFTILTRKQGASVPVNSGAFSGRTFYLAFSAFRPGSDYCLGPTPLLISSAATMSQGYFIGVTTNNLGGDALMNYTYLARNGYRSSARVHHPYYIKNELCSGWTQTTTAGNQYVSAGTFYSRTRLKRRLFNLDGGDDTESGDTTYVSNCHTSLDPNFLENMRSGTTVYTMPGHAYFYQFTKSGSTSTSRFAVKVTNSTSVSLTTTVTVKNKYIPYDKFYASGATTAGHTRYLTPNVAGDISGYTVGTIFDVELSHAATTTIDVATVSFYVNEEFLAEKTVDDFGRAGAMSKKGTSVAATYVPTGITEYTELALVLSPGSGDKFEYEFLPASHASGMTSNYKIASQTYRFALDSVTVTTSDDADNIIWIGSAHDVPNGAANVPLSVTVNHQTGITSYITTRITVTTSNLYALGELRAVYGYGTQSYDSAIIDLNNVSGSYMGSVVFTKILNNDTSFGAFSVSFSTKLYITPVQGH